MFINYTPESEQARKRTRITRNQHINTPVVCSLCNEEGHSRRTSRLCRFYSESSSTAVLTNDSARVNQVESSASDDQINDNSLPNEAESANPIGNCNECLSEDHCTTDCPILFYKNNPQMNTYKVAHDQSKISQLKRHDFGRMRVECSFCHAMLWLNERASASKSEPLFQLCCGKGRYIMKDFEPLPPLLTGLLTNTDPVSKEFQNNIRAYNNVLSFTSLGVKLDHDVNNDRMGAYAFRIHGNVYHRIGTSLHPEDGAAPSFAQIYVYDAANELQNRLHRMPFLASDTLHQLQSLMHSVNPYARDFKTMADLVNETPGGLPDVSMIFRSEDTPDPRRYNSPTHSTEIGVLIVNGEGHRNVNKPTHRDVVIRLRNNGSTENGLQSINEINQHYDPMHYVLMFPRGDPGWNINMHTANGLKKVTIMQFYRYHLMIRQTSPSQVHLFKHLFHQYVVEMYAKMEQERLNCLRHNQKSLRCELYNNLRDAAEVDDGDMESVGKKVILPSSFIGSPRHMVQLHQDSMSIVRRFGKPDLFVTFTCNPSWPEITNELQYNQTSNDRPDLCSRVFHLKLKSLMHDLTVRNVLGKVIAHMHVIEFQKRGLPHCHILLILDASDKLREKNIDNVVSAEISDKQVNPSLYETVTKNLMHGPCGLLDPYAPCMKDGKCSKSHPKTFNDTIHFKREEQGGYPLYRRIMSQKP